MKSYNFSSQKNDQQKKSTLKAIKSVLLVLLISLAVDTVHAQVAIDENEEIPAYSEQFPGLPFYSFGSGLGITTPDSTYRLNIRFRMQSRATYLDVENEDPIVEGLVRRLRLRFDGFVGDPRFLYAIQLSFAPDDVGTLTEGDNLNVIRDAVFFYRPNRSWSFAFGQTKLPGNRQRVNSSGALQLTDRSINNATFTIDRDYGVQVFFLRERSDVFSYNVKTALSTGNGRNWTQNPGTGLAYTGRLELFPLGAFTAGGSQFEGDLMREDSPKVLLAGTYHYNDDAQRARGQLGSTLFERRDLTSVHLDGMIKYRGWAFQTAFMNRNTENPITSDPSNPDNIRFVHTGHGYDAQLSYLFRNNVELIGRYSSQTPGSEIREIQPDREQYSAGITRYIWEHALKLQTEFTYTDNSLPGSDAHNSWYLRFQVEIGI